MPVTSSGYQEGRNAAWYSSKPIADTRYTPYPQETKKYPSNDASDAEPSAEGTTKCGQQRRPDVKSPPSARLVTILRISTAITIGPFDTGDDVKHTCPGGEQRLTNAAN
mmetsp:Transcript_50510/g.83717  ORF Transcript_50510/g.83717 Transcript_50510/m.83717 type:complete len:109 (+) Transcript_50510:378-704(+)